MELATLAKVVQDQVVDKNPIPAEAGAVHEAAASTPHISIKAEPLFNLFGLEVTNSLLTSWIALAILIVLAYLYTKKGSVYQVMNLMLRGIYGLFASVFGGKVDVFFPLVASFFIYILFLNWLGLLPGVGTLLVKVHGEMVPLLRAGTADLNTTLALGFFSVLMIQVFSVKYLGWGKYLGKFFNFTNPIKTFVGLLEIISEISKAISFSFRLFGNIFAGEVLLTVVAFLVPVLASFPFLVFEFFVGFIQALVFSMLSAIMLSVAITDHSH